MDAQIRDVVNGIFEIVVHVAQSGDRGCCRSGRPPASFVLRDHELVRLPADQPGT